MKHGGVWEGVCVVLLILVIAAGLFALASIVGSMPWSLLGRTM
jgi:hypothetical protein